MRLSVVTTLFQSSGTVQEFYRRMKASAEAVTDDYELILVNDGSPDDSLSKALALYRGDSRLKVIDLSRNFGHHRAMMTGLSYVTGERVFLIDSDLEEAPENLRLFWKALSEDGELDVVFGVLKQRKGGVFERISGAFFYKLMKFLCDERIAGYTAVSRLMSRRYVDSLLRFEESELYLPGLWHLTGYDQEPLCIDKKSTSKSSYTLRKKLHLSVNAITCFSNRPLHLIFLVGMTTSCIAFLFFVYFITRKVFFSSPITGWTSLIVSIWLIAGMMFSFLGIIGIYLSRVFSESKNRPNVIVKDTYVHKDN